MQAVLLAIFLTILRKSFCCFVAIVGANLFIIRIVLSHVPKVKLK